VAGRPRFDQAALDAVAEAVSAAENRTAGEIVTYVVEECDPYPEAGWRGGLYGALLAAGGAVAVHATTGAWDASLLVWSLLPVLGGGLVGLWAGDRVPPLRRLLVPRAVLERRVAMRAEAAFLEEEVFDTRDRSGILLFLALFEHRAIVLGDAGINQVVPEAEWKSIVDDLIAGIRSGDAVGALQAAVERCGRLLEERGVRIRPDDVDELPDAPRVRET
jgi:putative membrane protein